MKIALAIIAMIVSGTFTQQINASTALNGCVRINPALAAQISDIHELLDSAVSGQTINEACDAVSDLSSSLDGLLNGVVDGVLAPVVTGLLGGLGLGGLGNLVNGVLGTVTSLLSSVLSLVNNIVDNLLGTTCGLTSDVVNQIHLTDTDINALTNVNLCFNPNLLLLVNLKNNAFKQLTMTQAQALVELINRLAAASNPNVQLAIR